MLVEVPQASHVENVSNNAELDHPLELDAIKQITFAVVSTYEGS